jgi:hypothetical protein
LNRESKIEKREGRREKGGVEGKGTGVISAVI